MASYKGAEARISDLIGLTFGHRKTPNTITRNWEGVVKSYGLPIGLHRAIDGDRIAVKTEPNSSVTTNRHIRAFHNVLIGAGYIEVGWIVYCGDKFTTYVPVGA